MPLLQKEIKLKNYKKNIGGLLIAFVLSFALQIIVAFAVMIPVTLLGQNPNEFLGLTVVVTHVVLLISFGLWYGCGCCRNREIKNSLSKISNGKSIVIIGVLAIGSCFLTNFAMPIAGMFIPEDVMEAYLELMETAGFGENILPTIAAVLIAPIGEELVFRGVIHHYAGNLVAAMKSKKTAFYVANIIQALAFGVFHGNLVQGTYAFFLGLVLGYLRERFHTILAPILAHMLINASSSFLWDPIVLLLPDSLLVFGAGSLIFCIIVLIGFKLGGPAVASEEN